MQISKKKLGDIGEEKAFQYLKQQGLKLVEKNFYSRFGEIDLIMLDTCHSKKLITSQTVNTNYLVFIEVRSRKNMGFGSALESITLAKQTKLRKTADFFFLKNKKYSKMAARFDVFIVSSTSDNDNNWIKNAF